MDNSYSLLATLYLRSFSSDWLLDTDDLQIHNIMGTWSYK